MAIDISLSLHICLLSVCMPNCLLLPTHPHLSTHPPSILHNCQCFWWTLSSVWMWYVCARACMCVYTCVCMSVYVVCVRVCVCVCTLVYVCVYMWGVYVCVQCFQIYILVLILSKIYFISFLLLSVFKTISHFISGWPELFIVEWADIKKITGICLPSFI